MVKGTCKMCGETNWPDAFYPNSSIRCKRCVNALNRKRYHRDYRPELAKERWQRSQEKKRKPIVQSETDRAYAAGIIDGEGCIRITARGKDGGKAFRLCQYTLMVEVINTDKGMIDWLVAQYGGNVTYRAESQKDNRKERWHWRVSANQALYVLDAIWPYIRTKRRQAKLGRRFQRYAQYAGRAATDKIRLLHQRFYAELRVLNKRGVRN